MSAKIKRCSILIAALLMIMARSARAEDYFIEVIERPANNQLDRTSRTGRYKFRIKIHPTSSLERIDGYGKVCVADTARFKWALETFPQIPPLQSRTDSKEVEGTVNATGDWTGQNNAYFSVALPSYNCAGNGLSPTGQSNRVQESVRVPEAPRPLNLPNTEPVQRPPALGPTATLPPYRLKVYPATNATSATAIRFRAEATGTGSSAFCKYEAVPTSGGTAWSNVSTDCTEATTTLAAGTYELRLTTRVARAGGAFEDLTEEKRNYVVVPQPNYTIPVLATELFRSTRHREYGERLEPCDGLYDPTVPGYSISLGIICDMAHPVGRKHDMEFDPTLRLKNGWRIKQIEVEKSQYLGDFNWVVKPTEGSDNPYTRIRYWVNAHAAALTEIGTKFIRVKVKIWIEGPSHLSPYEANQPRQPR